MQQKKHKFLALELLLLTKSDNLTNWEKFCMAGWKCTKELMWYTYEVCNNINLLKNVEKEVLMYFQIENSLLSNGATKSNLQMQSLSPILRMLILELQHSALQWCLDVDEGKKRSPCLSSTQWYSNIFWVGKPKKQNFLMTAFRGRRGWRRPPSEGGRFWGWKKNLQKIII